MVPLAKRAQDGPTGGFLKADLAGRLFPRVSPGKRGREESSSTGHRRYAPTHTIPLLSVLSPSECKIPF